MHQVAETDERLKRFILENWAELNQLDAHVEALTRDAVHPTTIAELARSIHVINGMCGVFGLTQLSQVAWAQSKSWSRCMRVGWMLRQPLSTWF